MRSARVAAHQEGVPTRARIICYCITATVTACMGKGHATVRGQQKEGHHTFSSTP
jgi:hypothetical protein